MLKIEKIHADHRLEKKLREIAYIRVQVNVGVLNGATYDDGTSVAMVAYKNETGGDKNPKRPFLRRTLKKNQRKWVRGIVANVRGLGINRASVLRAYKLCGMVAAGDVKRTIRKWPVNDPRRNSQKTIRMKEERAREGKGMQKINPEQPLIDTGTMLENITYEVKG